MSAQLPYLLTLAGIRKRGRDMVAGAAPPWHNHRSWPGIPVSSISKSRIIHPRAISLPLPAGSNF